MTYDQAQSPRLGQKLPPEAPGLQLLTINTLPEAAFRGQVVYLTDQAEFSIFDGDAWQSPTGGGSTGQTFISDTEPTADNVGDLWFNPSNAQLSIWMDFEGTLQWRPMIDPMTSMRDLNRSNALAGVLTALTDVPSLGSDKKIVVYYQTTQPTTAQAQDLWYATGTNKLWRFTTVWTEITNADQVSAVAQALAGQSDAQLQATWDSVAPIGLNSFNTADLWFDTGHSNLLNRWSGAAWIDVADARDANGAQLISSVEDQLGDLSNQVDGKVDTYFQTTPPWNDGDATHLVDDGDLWFDATAKILKRWNGVVTGATYRTWVQIKDQQMIDAYDKAGAAQTTANAKISQWVGNTPPWNNGDTTHALDHGDIWTQTPDNLKYFWNDTLKAWVAQPVGPNAVTGDVMNYKTITGATLQTSTTNVNTVRIDLSGIKIYGAVSGVTVFEATNTGVLNLKTELNAAGGSIKGGVVYGGTISTATTLSGGLPTGARVDLSTSFSSTIKMYAGLASESPGTIESYNSGGYGQLNLTSPTTGSKAYCQIQLVSANSFSNDYVALSSSSTGAISLSAGSGGVQVSSGAGLVVNSGGIHVTGTSNFQNNLTVANGANFTVASGGAINFNGPLNMNGGGIGTVGGSGLTIDSGGLLVKAGGVVVNAGGGGVTAQGITATSSFTNTGLVGGQTTTCTINTSNQYVRTGSTRRIKKDITDLSGALVDKILALPPRMFRYNEDQLMGDWFHAGFIAEEAHDLGLDLWVSTDENGEIESFDYLGFTAGLLLTVQALASRIETLEGN